MSSEALVMPILPSLASVLAAVANSGSQEQAAKMAQAHPRGMPYGSNSYDENEASSSSSSSSSSESSRPFPWPMASVDTQSPMGDSSPDHDSSPASTPPHHSSTALPYKPAFFLVPPLSGSPRAVLPTFATARPGSPSSFATSQDPDQPYPTGAAGLADRRRWRLRLERKYAGAARGLVQAHLQVAVRGLAAALPPPGQRVLLAALRAYCGGEIAPEAFAELLKQLVDQYDVRVPTGLPNAQVAAAPPCSAAAALENIRSRDGAKRGRDAAAGPGGGRVKQRKTAGLPSAPGGLGAKDKPKESGGDNMAWEALVSVCSNL
jgi:hypothetical protein